VQRVREQNAASVGAVQRHTRFVAGGFDSEDQHRRHSTAASLADTSASVGAIDRGQSAAPSAREESIFQSIGLRHKLMAISSPRGQAMSSTLQQVEIDGQVIWVEVDDLRVLTPGSRDVSAGKFADTSARTNVAETISKVDLSATLDAVVGPVKKALDKFTPDEVNLELTLGFKGEVGVFVASSEASAQVKVSVKWKPTVGKG
jgi:hypothetical protein